MKNSVWLWVVLMSLGIANAQNDHKYALKVYSVHSFDRYSLSSGATESYYRISPSFGFQWQGKKQRWHEVQFKQGEMGLGKINQYFTGSNGQSLYVNGRAYSGLLNMSYESNWYLFKTPHKWMPSLGAGVQAELYLYHFNVIGNKSNINSSRVTPTCYFVPRLAYNFTPRLFLDVNAQINLLSVQMQRNKNVNTYNNTRSSSFDTEANFLQNNNVKVGVGYRF